MTTTTENPMPDMFSPEDYLAHFGVKGMKWGKTKGSTTNSSHTSADAARVKKIETRLSKNGTANLSNDDIAKLNKRSQLLSEYKKNNPSKLDKGHKSVKNALAVVTTLTTAAVVGKKVVTSPAAKAGARIVSDIIKNMATGQTGPANGGTYVQVFKAIAS